MRRSLAGVLVAFAMLVSAAPALADDQTTASLLFPVGGEFGVHFSTDNEEQNGRDAVNLVVAKRGRYVIYSLERKVVTREGIDVAFGRLGRFRADFQPIAVVGDDGCYGITRRGWFVGEFHLRGERDYVHFDRERVKGTMTTVPDRCSQRRPLASRREEATLEARLPGKKPRVVEAFHQPGEGNLFTAAVGVRREGMWVGHVTLAQSGGRRFNFDHRRGTATIRPPWPFTGVAHFVRHPNGRNQWRGTLSAPLLGYGRVRFAGPGFRAGMKRDLPNQE